MEMNSFIFFLMHKRVLKFYVITCLMCSLYLRIIIGQFFFFQRLPSAVILRYRYSPHIHLKLNQLTRCFTITTLRSWVPNNKVTVQFSSCTFPSIFMSQLYSLICRLSQRLSYRVSYSNSSVTGAVLESCRIDHIFFLGRRPFGVHEDNCFLV